MYRYHYCQRLALCLLSVVSIGCATAPAQTTWFVATNGSDTEHSGTNGWADAYLTISNAVENAADDNGDRILVGPGRYVLDATITNCKVLALESAAGAEMTVLDGNYPVYRQRGLVIGRAGAVVSGFTISNCVYDHYQGGGVRVTNGLIANCIIEHCSASNYGGGLYLAYDALASNCMVRWNVVTNGHGGGVSVGGNAVILDSEIVSNTVSDSGGGITIEGNGGMISGCYIAHNIATNNGGGVNLRTNAVLCNSILDGNVSSGAQGGGGIYQYRGGEVRNCLIMNNMTSPEYGGGIYVNRFGLIESCTIVSNRAERGGGIAFVAQSVADGMFVRNTIISSNAASQGANLRMFLYLSQSFTWLTNCCATDLDGYGPIQGSGNTTNYPLFVNPDPANPDYRLQKGSPCVNTGSNYPWMAQDVDVSGLRRVDRFSGRVDMGCYEHIPDGVIFSLR